MFTGIVTAVGKVRSAAHVAGGRALVIDAPWNDLELGESIAVDGACLTVTAIAPGGFEVRVITTSLERTLFGGYEAGRPVNLERALRVGDRLGGHMVQGHVDGWGTVLQIRSHGDALLIDIRVGAEILAVSIPLGSIVIDGVALTINAIPAPEVIQVSLIPFTLEHTTLALRRVGDRVHVEGDTVGKYINQMAASWREKAES